MKYIFRKLFELPNKLYNYLLMKYYAVLYGENCEFKGRLIIQGKGSISIGNNTRIKSGLKFNPIGGDSKSILIARYGGKIIVGNNVGMSNSTIVSHSQVVIGNNVLLGGGVKIYDTDFHSIVYDERMSGNVGTKNKPVEIKEGVFIGAHTIVLKGVTIGEHSVIGAGSVVTKSVPPHQVWAGNPARFIKNLEI